MANTTKTSPTQHFQKRLRIPVSFFMSQNYTFKRHAERKAMIRSK